jgi:hypothetical protein
MKISMHTMAVETFAPMLVSLAEVLEKGAEHAKKTDVDLIDARLAPDMYTLAQQVQQACYYAKDGIERLTGRPPARMEDAEKTFVGLASQIKRTVALVRTAPLASFEDADERDCSLNTPDGRVIEMDGVRFLRAWLLPHFYFHIVTAYDILRHHGVEIGKQDYLSQVGAFIRDKK